MKLELGDLLTDPRELNVDPPPYGGRAAGSEWDRPSLDTYEQRQASRISGPRLFVRRTSPEPSAFIT